MGANPKMSDKETLSQSYNKKGDSLDPKNLSILDLTEQVQALYPSELKTQPINEDMLNRFNIRDFNDAQIGTSRKKEEKLQSSQ